MTPSSRSSAPPSTTGWPRNHAAAGLHPPAPARAPGARVRRVRDHLLPGAAAARARARRRGGCRPAPVWSARSAPVNPVVVLRADIDALPLPDLKDVALRVDPRGHVPRLRARRAHDRRARASSSRWPRWTGCPGTVRGGLPAGRGDHPRRCHRGGRLRGARRRLAGVRPALRPVGARGHGRSAHRGDHRGLRPDRRHADRPRRAHRPPAAHGRPRRRARPADHRPARRCCPGRSTPARGCPWSGVR